MFRSVSAIHVFAAAGACLCRCYHMQAPCYLSSVHVSILTCMVPACRVYLNPAAGERRTGISSSPWAAQEGQDFLTNNVVPSIDFATVHIWMDNWLGYGDFSTCILCDNQFDYTHGEPQSTAIHVPAACELSSIQSVMLLHRPFTKGCPAVMAHVVALVNFFLSHSVIEHACLPMLPVLSSCMASSIGASA